MGVVLEMVGAQAQVEDSVGVPRLTGRLWRGKGRETEGEGQREREREIKVERVSVHEKERCEGKSVTR